MTSPVDSARPSVLERLRSEVYPVVFTDRVIGVADDFFEAGGDSVELMRLLAVAQDSFGVEIRVSTFFQEPTMDHLADLIGEELDIP